VGLGKGGGVLGKASHNRKIGVPDSELYHQVPHVFLQKTVDSMTGRLRKLVDTAGAYVEF
jgi:hypothetical protein